MTRILCVDSDRFLTDLLRYALEREGFDVSIAHTERDAVRLVRERRPHLVALDLDGDGIDGATVGTLPVLRALSRAPIVALSMAARDEDVIAGFDRGADDYVTKPFNVEVFVVRVKALLRRSGLTTERERERQGSGGAATYRIRGAVFDVALNRIVGIVGFGDGRGPLGDGDGSDGGPGVGVCITLTPTQSRILHLLFLHEGQAVPVERITTHVWGEDSAGKAGSAGVVRTHIRHLRAKIAQLPGHPQPIRTLPGLGYMARQIDEEGRSISD